MVNRDNLIEEITLTMHIASPEPLVSLFARVNRIMEAAYLNTRADIYLY
jgi:hypothetical protein